MRRYISRLILVAVVIAIGILLYHYSISFTANKQSEISHKKFETGNYEVRFLQPPGTPLTFYQLPNGDYYTILRIQTQTNTTNLPVSFPVPVRAVPLAVTYDNKTGMYNETYAVVISKDWFFKMSKNGIIYLQSSSSGLSYYSINFVNATGPYAQEILSALGNLTNTSNNGNLAPSNSTVINAITQLFAGAVVSVPPVTGGRTFDALIYTPTTSLSTATVGKLSAYATATLTSTPTVKFIFGYGGTSLNVENLQASGNIVIVIPNTTTSGSYIDIAGVSISYDGTQFNVTTSSNTYTVTVKPLALMLTPDGSIYELLPGNAVKLGTFSGYGSTITLTIYQPGVLVGFTNATPEEAVKIDPSKVESVFTTAYEYLKEYATLSESAVKDKIKAEYYSILNTYGLSVSSNFIPTTVATGNYYGNSTYELYVSASNVFVESVGGNSAVSSYLAKGSIPIDYVSDYVDSPNGFKAITSTTPSTETLTPVITPAGSLRTLFFGNVTFITKNMSWVFSSKTITDEMKGYSFTPIYQGGLPDKYLVLTQYNVTNVAPVPISWEWINRRVATYSVFCCFVTIKIYADGISVTIDQSPVNVSIVGDGGKYKMSFDNYPYSIALLKTLYTKGFDCELSLAGAPTGYKCPIMYIMAYKVFNLYQYAEPVKTIEWETKMEWYQDEPCFPFNVNIDSIVIVPGFKKYDLPDEFTFLNSVFNAVSWWLDADGKYLGFPADIVVFGNFMDKVFKKDYAYANYKIALLTRKSG